MALAKPAGNYNEKRWYTSCQKLKPEMTLRFHNVNMLNTLMEMWETYCNWAAAWVHNITEWHPRHDVNVPSKLSLIVDWEAKPAGNNEKRWYTSCQKLKPEMTLRFHNVICWTHLWRCGRLTAIEQEHEYTTSQNDTHVLMSRCRSNWF